MTQERQKAAPGSGRDRQADDIARSYARLFPRTARLSWQGAAALSAAVGLSLTALAFLASGERPFAPPGPPELRLAETAPSVPSQVPPPAAAPVVPAPQAAPALPPAPDPAPPAIAVPVHAGAPALVPPPRPGPRTLAAAPLRPRARPEAGLVARAPSAMASLADLSVTPHAPLPRGTACGAQLAAAIPARPGGAAAGSALARAMDGLTGSGRDGLIARELLRGNIPAFLRDLTPVTLAGRMPDGRRAEVTICVTPDYLALGSDADFLRVPMGLPAAALVADRFGFLLPTTRMVDAVHAQAGLRLAPQPMTPGAEMTSTRYFRQHNSTVQGQTRGRAGLLTAGQKKDLVLTNRLREMPGRVAIYGWHRPDGQPIQPLSTVHGARYADYSHGVRLVSQTAFVKGRPVALAALLADPAFAAILTGEGPIAAPDRLLASLYR
ncbi:hypothetical protein NHN26_02570 [Rhodovulum tesquicola]|uniref:hypothetical protein n=1 Tax=Rhodovulum tesquicola TaxID=540254 RepID=UPI0020979CA8|nr:hypothetical protein [Rhodovulum tesquicola]MCO8144102.1 hypothetical protein [Rhodovulum tesquicola]